jgi:hypothetical protein
MSNWSEYLLNQDSSNLVKRNSYRNYFTVIGLSRTVFLSFEVDMKHSSR